MGDDHNRGTFEEEGTVPLTRSRGTRAREVQSIESNPYRTVVSASLYLFLSYFCVAATWPVGIEVILGFTCKKHGLDEDRCHEPTDGTRSPAYERVQADAAIWQAFYQTGVSIPPVFVCSLYGLLGDQSGRRSPMLAPLIGYMIGTAAWGLLEDPVTIAVICIVLGLSGGMYVFNLSGFSALADVTQRVSPEQRSRIFAIGEGAVFLGQLLGPLAGGFLSQWLGPKNAMLAITVGFCADFLLTFVGFPESLDPARRRRIDWRRANPLAALLLFFETRTTFLLALQCLFALTAMSGGLANVSLYSIKAANFSPEAVGALQSMVLGSSTLGLFVIMHLLVRCLPLKWVSCISGINAVLAWLLMSTATKAWQFFTYAGSMVLIACFFPVVRVGFSNTFGRERYGESLAAIAVLENICSLIALPIVNGIYYSTLTTELRLGPVTVHCMAYIGVAGLFALSALAAALLPGIPKELQPPSAALSIVPEETEVGTC